MKQLKLILVLLVSLHFTACLYTKSAAVRNFGCKTDSIRIVTNTTHTVDTFYEPFFLPQDTVTVPSPCEEIAKMKPGESKIKKGSRTTAVFGKDTAGKSYFICLADEYKDSMEWYKEKWHTTVYKTEYKHQPIHQNCLEKNWYYFLIGLMAILILLILVRK